MFDKLLAYISQYNFLTNILPGSVLCILLNCLLGMDIIPSETYKAGIVFYFVGMVNNRIGSLVIEPVLKKLKFIQFASYPKFIEAEDKDSKVTLLNQECNVFRSYTAVGLILILAYTYDHLIEICQFVKDNQKLFGIILLFLLFCFSYRKQVGYVRERVEKRTQADQ